MSEILSFLRSVEGHVINKDKRPNVSGQKRTLKLSGVYLSFFKTGFKS